MAFWNRKKPPEPEPFNPAELMHRFLLDSRLAESQQLSMLLGLTPLDDPDVEQEASTLRVARAGFLMPILFYFSMAMSSAVVEYMRTMGTPDRRLTDEEAEAMSELMGRVSLSTVLGTICQLEELGFIHYPHRRIK